MTIDDSYLYDPGEPIDWERYYGEKEDKEYQEWKDSKYEEEFNKI